MKKHRLSDRVYVEFYKGRKMVSEDQDWDTADAYVQGASRIRFNTKADYHIFKSIVQVARDDGKNWVRKKFQDLIGIYR